MTSNSKTFLDVLNSELAKDLTIPTFRRQVDLSGRNLEFFHKKYRGTNPVVIRLVKLSLAELKQPVDVEELEPA